MALCSRKEGNYQKNFFKLILFLDIFQYKNHIWYINKNFIFLAVSSLSTAKGPYIVSPITKYPHDIISPLYNILLPKILSISQSTHGYYIIYKYGILYYTQGILGSAIR